MLNHSTYFTPCLFNRVYPVKQTGSELGALGGPIYGFTKYLVMHTHLYVTVAVYTTLLSCFRG